MIARRHVFTSLAAFGAIGPFAGRALAQAPTEPLTIGYYEIPPYLEMVDGRLQGVLVDVWDDLARKLGLAYTPVNLPPARLVRTLAEGDVDVTLTPINFPEYAGRALFSKAPVEHIILEAYNFGPRPLVRTIKDLVGMSVIIQQGFGYGGLINFLKAPENKVSIAAVVPHLENGMRMLQADRAEVLLHYRPAVDRLRQQWAIGNLRSTVLSAVPIHVVLSKSVPFSAELMARFDAVINPSVFVQ